MTPPAPPPARPGEPELADAKEHSTAEGVAWSGKRAVVVGSAGRIDDRTPVTGDPVFADGARYHGWIRGIDEQGATAWTRRLEGGRELHVRAVAALGDDVVIAGEQRSGDVRAYTGWLACVAADGRERWRLEALGTAGVTGLHAVAVRRDGVVVAGGMQRGKAWLVAVDGQGKRRWDHDLAGLDEVTAVMASADGVVVAGVVGRTTIAAGTSQVVAVDAAGTVRWTTAAPAHGRGELVALAPLGDGGVAVGQAPGAEGRDGIWIVRFAADGAIRSSEVLPAIGSAAANAVTATDDGGFVVAGEVLEDIRHRQAQVWRFDRTGQLRWHQAWGDRDPLVRALAATPDGGAVVVGATQAAGSPLRPWIVGIDRDGSRRWTAP